MKMVQDQADRIGVFILATAVAVAVSLIFLAVTGRLGAQGEPVILDVTAQPGDTCWSLAARHVPESADTDLRQVVDGMGDCSNLQPGDELTITFTP